VEGLAARFAAERGVEPARLIEVRRLLERLDQVLEKREDDFDFSAYIELNEAFHKRILDFAQSGVLTEQMERVTALPFSGPSAFVEAQSMMPRSLETLVIAQHQHKAITEAIELREGARAEALMKEHARLARRNLEAVFDSDKLRARVPGLTLVSTQA